MERKAESMTSAAAKGLVSCTECALVSRPLTADAPGHCPRCGQKLEFRRANAIQRTWALLIAATVLYAPANLLPVLATNTITTSHDDTIMSGVIYLYASGSWPLALIVFVASIVIPIGKIATLGYVLVTVQRDMRASAVPTGRPEELLRPLGGQRAKRAWGSNRQRTRLYRIVEFIGRWSMLDVFVDTYIVALVQLSPLMSVEPGPGVVYFMAVVVLTMFAAMSFDSRLIWDGSTPMLATKADSSLAAPQGGATGPRGGPSDLRGVDHGR
jgi:paraquat-inducible protein A